jgi:hypothetical protein
MRRLVAVVLLTVGGNLVDAQTKTITPDLAAVAEGKGASVPASVTVNWVQDAKGRPALRVQPASQGSAPEAEQVVVLTGVELANGTIEFDVLGQSGPPQSNFIGVAFRLVDQKTHDVVYFRPFNFRAADPERRAHAVQYVSHPGHRWPDLRKNQPGRYEKPIVPAPDGDAWFHARIVIERPKVSVYVDGATEPSLVVEELSGRTGGGVGLWVGPGQGGHFANVKITTMK